MRVVELSLTNRTKKFANPEMEVDVFLKICALGEGFGAARHRAGEGFFLRVDTQVVEEIAAFPKLFPTARIRAFHDSPDSLRSRVLISQYFKMGGVGNMFASANSVESFTVSLSIFLSYYFSGLKENVL